MFFTASMDRRAARFFSRFSSLPGSFRGRRRPGWVFVEILVSCGIALFVVLGALDVMSSLLRHAAVMDERLSDRLALSSRLEELNAGKAIAFSGGTPPFADVSLPVSVGGTMHELTWRAWKMDGK